MRCRAGWERRSREVSSQMVDLSFIISPFILEILFVMTNNGQNERVCVICVYMWHWSCFAVLVCYADRLLVARFVKEFWASRCSVSKVSTGLTGCGHCLLRRHFKAFFFHLRWTAYATVAPERYVQFEDGSRIKLEREMILFKCYFKYMNCNHWYSSICNCLHNSSTKNVKSV